MLAKYTNRRDNGGDDNNDEREIMTRKEARIIDSFDGSKLLYIKLTSVMYIRQYLRTGN